MRAVYATDVMGNGGITKAMCNILVDTMHTTYHICIVLYSTCQVRFQKVPKAIPAESAAANNNPRLSIILALIDPSTY